VLTGYPLKAKIITKNNISRRLYLKDISVFGVGGDIRGKLDNFKLGDSVNLSLEFEEEELDFKGNIVYIGEQGGLGIQMSTPTGEDATSFFQLISPIRIGQSFVEIEKDDHHQSEEKYSKRMFTSLQGASLTIWTDSNDDSFKIFEFKMEDFFLRKNEDGKREVYSTSDSSDYKKLHRSKLLNELDTNDEKVSEIERLFDLILMNTKNVFSADMRSFLKD